MNNYLDVLLSAIKEERRRQNIIHPSFPKFDSSRFLILTEEFGEIAKALNDEDDENLKIELIQLASVCVRWLEEIKRDEFDE